MAIKGWEYQEHIDVEQASNDRNMTDYCAYFEGGKPFVTLAGFMKIANEEGFDSEVERVEIDQHKIHVVMKCLNGDGRAMFSGRTEYLIGRDGKPDQHALAKAMNIATKNAVKQLLYGHPKIEQMLDEFTKSTPYVHEEKQEPNPKASESSPPKPAPKPAGNGKEKQKSKKDQALSWYNTRVTELDKINKHGKVSNEVINDWLIYFLIADPDTMTDREYERIVSELKKEDMGLIGNFFKKRPEDANEVIKNHGDMIAKTKEAKAKESSDAKF